MTCKPFLLFFYFCFDAIVLFIYSMHCIQKKRTPVLFPTLWKYIFINTFVVITVSFHFTCILQRHIITCEYLDPLIGAVSSKLSVLLSNR